MGLSAGKLNLYLGIVEQIAFSLFSFLIISYVGIFREAEYAAYFIKIFSFVAAIYLLCSVLVIQPFSAFMVKSRGEYTRARARAILLLVILVIFLSSCLFVSLACFDLIVINFYTCAILIGMPFGWVILDISRKYNIYAGKERANLVITGLIYLPLLGIFLISEMTPINFPSIELCLVIIMSTLSLMLLRHSLDYRDFHIHLFRAQALSYWKYGCPLIIGVSVYWLYSQGVYIALGDFSTPEIVVDARMAQNYSSVIGVALLYFEAKYLAKIGQTFNSHGNSAVLRDIRKSIRVFLALSFLLFSIFVVVLYLLTYSFNVISVQFSIFIGIFVASNLLLGCVKPVIVGLRFYRKTNLILVAHLYAVLTSLVGYWFLSLHQYWLGYTCLFLLPYVAFVIVISFKGVVKHEYPID